MYLSVSTITAVRFNWVSVMSPPDAAGRNCSAISAALIGHPKCRTIVAETVTLLPSSTRWRSSSNSSPALLNWLSDMSSTPDRRRMALHFLYNMKNIFVWSVVEKRIAVHIVRKARTGKINIFEIFSPINIIKQEIFKFCT